MWYKSVALYFVGATTFSEPEGARGSNSYKNLLQANAERFSGPIPQTGRKVAIPTERKVQTESLTSTRASLHLVYSLEEHLHYALWENILQQGCPEAPLPIFQ